MCDNHAHSGPLDGQIGKEIANVLSKMLVLVSLTVVRTPTRADFDPEIHFTRALARCTRVTKLHVCIILPPDLHFSCSMMGRHTAKYTILGQTRPVRLSAYPSVLLIDLKYGYTIISVPSRQSPPLHVKIRDTHDMPPGQAAPVPGL